MPLTKIGYKTFLGKPLVIWVGIAAMLLLILTVLTAVLNIHMGISAIPFSVHRILGYAVLVFALLHGFLAFSARFP